MTRFNNFLFFIVLNSLNLAQAAPPTAPNEAPRLVQIGQGGSDGVLATGQNGQIHVVFGGKYRTGPSPDRLSPEEPITDLMPVNTVRITIDASGRPHVVFTTGATDNAKRTYYTTRSNGRWLPAEKFADAADFPERSRAYVADVAADGAGHVLTSFWVSRPTEKRREYDNPSFYYRWRTPAGTWGTPHSLPAHWSSAAKVEYQPGRGFFLLWQHRGNEWRIAGPVSAGQPFSAEQSSSTGSETLTGLSTVQNEGADFTRTASGKFIVAGNVREQFEGPVGAWASLGVAEAATSTTYLGSFANTKRGDESGIHPFAAFDADTGAAFVTLMNPADKRAYYAVHDGARWHPYVPICPAQSSPQGTLRQGPSVADVPGPGVLSLVRDGQQEWYLCRLTPPVETAWNALGEIQQLGPGITPGICVDASGTIHVVSMGAGSIHYRRSAAPARFDPPEELPLPEGAATYNSPHLICDSQGTLHLTFQRDFTRASKKCWYMNRRDGKWSEPLLVLDRSGTDSRANYPRLAIRGDEVILGAFVGGGSAVAQIVDTATKPRVARTVETPLWVAHPLVDPRGQLWIVGREGSRGHKLERYSNDLVPLGDRVFLSRGTPTKTFEPTTAVVDATGVIHAAGATQSPLQVVWYSNSARAAAGQDAILGPELGHDIREDAYPVLHFDARGNFYLSYRHLETGEARLTILDQAAEKFAPPVTVAASVEKRLRWNPHLAAAPGGGVYVVWDSAGTIYFRPVGVAP